MVRLYQIARCTVFCAVIYSQLSAAQEPITQEYKQYYAAAVQAMKAGDYALALEQINLAEADTPGKIPTLNLRGSIYLKQHQYNLAVADFRKIIEINPEYPSGHFNLGEAYFQAGQYTEAKHAFRRYLQTKGNERNALARFKVFLCDLMSGNDAAVQQQLANLKPTISHPLEYYCRAAVQYHAGKQEEGESYVNSALKIYSPAINFLFLESFRKLGFIKQEQMARVDQIEEAALGMLSYEFMPTEQEESPKLEVLLPDLK